MAVQKGHIKLGAPGALRDYLLTDPKQFVATPANPMAAKIATGGGSYDDFENWSYWVQEDWSAGAGRHSDKVSNGYLFGTCASFMRGRLTLPFEKRVTGQKPETQAYYGLAQSANVIGELAVGTTGAYRKVAVLGIGGSKTTGGATYMRFGWFYILVDGTCSSITYEQYDVGAGTPPAISTLIGSGTIDISGLSPGGYWLALPDINSTSSDEYNYWAIYPTSSSETLYVPYWAYDSGVSGATPLAYNGSTWATPSVSAVNVGFFTYLCEYYMSISKFAGSMPYKVPDLVAVRGSDTIALTYTQNAGYEFPAIFDPAVDPEDEAWDGFSPTGTSPYLEEPYLYGGLVWGTDLYQAFGAVGLWKINSSNVQSEVGTDLATKVLAAWNGYLYRAADNQLWYTADGSTWTGPLSVGPTGTTVVSMAGLGDYLYIATSDGLYYLAPGDFIVGIAPWPSADSYSTPTQSSNGYPPLVNHAGSLYVPLKNRIWQFTQSGTFTDVWLGQDADIPNSYLGEIKWLVSTHLGLIALVEALDTTTQATVWLMTGEGWHCLAEMPKGIGAGKLLNDPTNARLWMFSTNGTAYAIPYRPLATIPVRDPEQRWEPYGWVESDWYYGSLVDVPKDWESVTVFGDNLSSGKKVRVFYKDSEAADWTLLGTATADNTELRWAQATYRPTSNRMKIGLLLSTNDKTSTPEVRAVRVKYLPMIADRWRWQLPLSVHADQQMLDGTLNTYTVAQQLAHLDGLVTQVKPVIFQDITGTQYEVKVLGASKQIIEFEARPDESRVTKWVYALSLEQVTDGTYS